MLRSCLLTLLVTAAACAQGPMAPTGQVGPKVVYDLQYAELSRDPKRNLLDLYLPADVAEPPLVLFVHGGSWMAGSKEDMVAVGRGLARLGAAAAVINYRLHPGARWPAFAEDAAAAFAWLHEHAGEYGCSRDRIFVMGHSAGAHIAAAVAFDPRWLRAHGLGQERIRGFIGLSGVYDLRPRHDLLAGIFGRKVAARADASPVLFADANAPPALLFWAEQDLHGLDLSGRMLVARLQGLGVPVRSQQLAGKNHIDYVFEFEHEPLDRIGPGIQTFLAARATPTPATPHESVGQALLPVAELAFGDGPQRIALHRPQADAPSPWLLLVRGSRLAATPMAEALARRGLAVAVLDVGLRPELAHPLGARTVAAAYAWLLGHAGELRLDATRGHLAGHGDGGLLSTLVALDPSWLTAAGASPKSIRRLISLSAPFDLRPQGHFPGVFPLAADARLQASPITWARKDGPPMLLVWAEREHAHWTHEQLPMIGRLVLAGQPHVAVELPGHDHTSYCANAGRPDDAITWMVLGFLGL